jgi:hypothetical protein
MHRVSKFISSLSLAAAIAAPILLVSEVNAQEASLQVRVYDGNHHDYHNWDSHEERAYRVYLTDHHREYRDYNHQSKKQQSNHWAWRHSHPDHH